MLRFYVSFIGHPSREEDVQINRIEVPSGSMTPKLCLLLLLVTVRVIRRQQKEREGEGDTGMKC